MSDIDALYSYRKQQATDTLAEAERMLSGEFSARTIINHLVFMLRQSSA